MLSSSRWIWLLVGWLVSCLFRRVCTWEWEWRVGWDNNRTNGGNVVMVGGRRWMGMRGKEGSLCDVTGYEYVAWSSGEDDALWYPRV